ncbi:hypothetical protein CDG77_13745 [Nostoc sp. 'Peltigera membranacea cyanobiont' 213]|nr:hypothetical protein CDG77_13745 [Nostoc sp. 'Peltigera membranacea cyanobiont' 213]
MGKKSNAYLLGGGIGCLAAAAFMIREGGIPGGNIFILEAKPLLGGSMDGGGNFSGGLPKGGPLITYTSFFRPSSVVSGSINFINMN